MELAGKKIPDQLKLSYEFQTRAAVREQIRKHCGIEMPIWTIGEYLKRWSFTPQKTAAYEQQPKRVEESVSDPRQPTGASQREGTGLA
jgi:hypothetical protein